jgi:hypothetical protein
VKKRNAFASHKYVRKSILRYALGVDFLAGSLVWMQGPYWQYTNIKISTESLPTSLSQASGLRLMRATAGMVHAWVGQKLVNSNILRVFLLRS